MSTALNKKHDSGGLLSFGVLKTPLIMKTVKQLQTERVKNRCQQINLIKNI